jgi:hypothetical protein
MAPMAPMPPLPPSGSFPLRYSGRLGNVNVEARAPGPVSTNIFGDSLIVVYYAGMEVKLQLRPGQRR